MLAKKTIATILGLVLSTTSTASILLTHLNKNHQWDSYTLQNVETLGTITTAGDYAWAIVDFNKIIFFDGKTWQQPFFVPGGANITDIKAGYPISGEKPTAWLMAGSTAFYFDGKNWVPCEKTKYTPKIPEMMTAGGNAWFNLSDELIGVANKADPTHLKLVKLPGKMIRQRLDLHYMVANSDTQPYLFTMVLSENNKSKVVLHRIDADGHDVVMRDLNYVASASPYLAVYQNNLLIAGSDGKYAYSNNSGANWVVSQNQKINIAPVSGIIGNFYCHMTKSNTGVECTDVSKSDAVVTITPVPKDVDGTLILPTENGAWRFSLAKYDFKMINPVAATATDIHFPANQLELGRYTTLSRGRMAVCGSAGKDKVTLGYYNGNKWELTPIKANGLGQASTTGNLTTFYVGNDNVWFGF